MIFCVPMKSYLRYRAGAKIFDLIKEEGLDPKKIRVFAGPAGGPKWFVSVGFDKALIRSKFLGKPGWRVLLTGASAGAWRCLAMACRDPLDAYERLRIAYSRNIFTAADTPLTVAQALKNNVDDFIQDDDVGYILNHPLFDVVVHTVRGKWLAASEKRLIQATGLIAAAFANIFSMRGVLFFFDRVVFYSGFGPPQFIKNFNGLAVGLNEANLKLAALATGSLPYVVTGVKNIPGAPQGIYRDGGLIDYQLNQDYCPGEDGYTLFFHYQERIIPGWFDKKFSWKKPPKGSLDRVIQVYPGPDFIRLLPDQRLPDRTDFITFVDDPGERIRRWDEVSRLSEILGEEFLEAVESKRVRGLVEPMPS